MNAQRANIHNLVAKLGELEHGVARNNVRVMQLIDELTQLLADSPSPAAEEPARDVTAGLKTGSPEYELARLELHHGAQAVSTEAALGLDADYDEAVSCYTKSLPEWHAHHRGDFVVLVGDHRVGFAKNPRALAVQASRLFPGRSVLVAKVE